MGCSSVALEKTVGEPDDWLVKFFAASFVAVHLGACNVVIALWVWVGVGVGSFAAHETATAKAGWRPCRHRIADFAGFGEEPMDREVKVALGRRGNEMY